MRRRHEAVRRADPLLSTACTTLEPKLAQPDPAIPASWPAADAALKQSEAALPAVTYRDIFRDGRLQTLIGEALVNNRDLMAAASNIQAALEQYHIQRAQQFPQFNAAAGVTVSGDRGGSGSSSGSVRVVLVRAPAMEADRTAAGSAPATRRD